MQSEKNVKKRPEIVNEKLNLSFCVKKEFVLLPSRNENYTHHQNFLKALKSECNYLTIEPCVI